MLMYKELFIYVTQIFIDVFFLHLLTKLKEEFNEEDIMYTSFCIINVSS